MAWQAVLPYIPAALSAIGSIGSMGSGPDKDPYEENRQMASQQWRNMLPGLQGGAQINPQLESVWRQLQQSGIDQQYNVAGQQLARTGLKGGSPQVMLQGLEASANVDADAKARLYAWDQAQQQYQQRLQLFQMLQQAAQQPQQDQGGGWLAGLSGLAGASGQAYGAHQGDRYLTALEGLGQQQQPGPWASGYQYG